MRRISARFVLSLMPKDGKDGKDGQDGKDGVGIEAIQVADAGRTLIYASFDQAALQGVKVVWMRMKFSNVATWTPWLKIVGEDGANGAYTDYTFAASAYLLTLDGSTTAPPQDCTDITWADGPVATTTQRPYLWMKVSDYGTDGQLARASSYIRLTGEKGADGLDGQNGKDAVEWVLRCNQPSVIFSWNNAAGKYTPDSVTLNFTYYKKVGGVVKENYGTQPSHFRISSGGRFNLFRRFLKPDGTWMTDSTGFYPWAWASSGQAMSSAWTYTAVEYCISTATDSHTYDETEYPGGIRDENIIALLRIPIIFYGKPGSNGHDGEDGRGVVNIVPYYVLSKRQSGVTTANTSGWTSGNFLTPTWDNPYLWRYYRTTYTDNSASDTPPEMVVAYTPTPGENLLEDTGFDTTYAMGAWDITGQDVDFDGTTATNAPGQAGMPGLQGHKSFFCHICGGSGMGYWFRTYNSTTAAFDLSGRKHKNLLRQKLWTASGNTGNRVEGGKWYTLSFWLRCEAFSLSGVKADDEEPQIYDRDDWVGVYLTGASNDATCLWNKAVQGYVDGVPTTFNRSGVRFVPTTSWVRHVITFQTLAESTLGSTARYLVFRGFPSCGGTSYDGGITYSGGRKQTLECYIAMPKLEEGLIATSYMDNALNRVGPPLRPREWAVSTQYFRGAMGEPFQDVAYYDAGNGVACYECILTHTSSIARRPGTTGGALYWRIAAASFDFLATKLLLARNAHIRLLTGNAITVARLSDGTTTAGVTGVGETDASVRFWAGAETPSTTAPFAVTQDGSLYASKLHATGGDFNGIKRIPAVKWVSFWVQDNDTYLIPGTVTDTVLVKLPIEKEYIGREIIILHSTGGAYDATALPSGNVSVLSVAADSPTMVYTRMLGMNNPAVVNAPFASYGFNFAYGSARLIGMPSKPTYDINDSSQTCTWVLLSCEAFSFKPLPAS